MTWALINILSAVVTWNVPAFWPVNGLCLVGWLCVDYRDYRAGRKVELALARERAARRRRVLTARHG